MTPRGLPGWAMAALLVSGLVSGLATATDARGRSRSSSARLIADRGSAPPMPDAAGLLPERNTFWTEVSAVRLRAAPATRRTGGDGRETVRPVAPAPTPAPAPTIALTFDDIPAHGPLPPGQTRVGIIRAIAAALKRAEAPAFGFLNGGIALDDPGAGTATAAWRAAGLPLGNHGYSHLDLDRVGAAAFIADIARNEAPLAAAAGGTDWHWFRYPFLSEGQAPVLRDAVRADLKARGYRIAAVTMGFDDYRWSQPYATCAARGDRRGIAALAAGFLADARTAANNARARARATVGRDIPYVLLMHVGGFDAYMLPRLLDLYRRMGFRFVTLPAAQADPFYAAANDPALPGPTPSLAGPAALPSLLPLAGPAPGLCS